MGRPSYLPKPSRLDGLDEYPSSTEGLAHELLKNPNLGEFPQFGAYRMVDSISPAMEKIHRMVRRVAPTDLTVLISGESGVGKEIIAQKIYS